MRRIYLAVALTALVFLSGSALSRESGLVGAFYGGWATHRGNYIWLEGHGGQDSTPLLADVTGDGRSDAVVVRDGRWGVAAASSNQSFRPPSTWKTSFGRQAVVTAADVNGDGRADAIAVRRNSQGRLNWRAAPAGDGAFGEAREWVSDFGGQSGVLLAGDVTGDGTADAVVVDGDEGTWRVAPSRYESGGTSSTRDRTWVEGMAPGAAAHFVADVTGDGAADAVAYDKDEQTWTVAVSNGEDGFSSPRVWRRDFGGDEVMVGDATGDGLADAVAFHRSSGDWHYAASDGDGKFGQEKRWKRGHGGRSPRPSKGLPQASHVLLGHCCGAAASPVAYYGPRGQWRVLPGDRWSSPGWDVNAWEARSADQFLPWIDGRYYGYDAVTDRFALDYLVKQAAEAKIDYIIYDQTNPWHALEDSYKAFSRSIADWNSNPDHRRMRYAFAVGFKRPGNPEAIERQARKAYERFLANDDYGGPSAYQNWNGKPLLIVYLAGNKQGPKIWKNYAGTKEYASKFTIRWMAGTIRRDTLPATLDNGDVYGWLMYDGSLPSEEQMVVQPGFYNGNKFHSRSYRGIEGDWYRRCSWDRVLRHRPRSVTIMGFTGDPEQVNVYIHDASTAHDMGKTETWAKDDMYWRMTKDYIDVYRRVLDGELQPVAQYGRSTVKEGSTKVQLDLPAEGPPAVLACVTGSPDGSPAGVRVTGVDADGFSLKLRDRERATVTWMAVRQGHWRASDGTPLDAGVRTISRAGTSRASVGFTGRFELSPVVLYQQRGAGGAFCGATDASHTFRSGFSPRLGSGDDGKSRVAWIAMGSREQRMWTGRDYTASRLQGTGSPSGRLFWFPFSFCDRPVLLAGFASSADARRGRRLSGLNRRGVCIAGAGSGAGPMTALALDGGGGVLYGRKAGE